jgi:hypothetical protein
MKIGAPEKARKKRDHLDFLLEELGEECQRTLELVNRLKHKPNDRARRGDILAELSASIVHLHVHTKDLPDFIDDELDREEDD